jgi:integrase/recombinase XerD
MTEIIKSLDTLIDDFIAFKQSIGHSYQTESYYLSRFKKHCNEMDCSEVPGKKEFQAWMVQRPDEKPQTQHTRLAPIREFHKYLHNIGIDTGYVLPKSIRISTQRYRPHFFHDDEILLFFKACDSISARKKNPGREFILPAAFRLVYCCGLRPIEVITLKTANVNLGNGYIDILQSKNHKDRRLYLSEDLTAYLIWYTQKIKDIWATHEYFFPKGSEKHYDESYLCLNFRKIWNSIRDDNIGENVRLYDMRHHFAFANINRWVQEGKNVNSMIVYLMKYMGHSSLESTYYYLHLVPEFFSTYTEVTRGLTDVLPEVGYED